jgi:four helix bundle protein
MGSASEVQYQLLLAHEIGFLSDSEFQRLESNVIEVKRMLATLIQKLKAEN